MFKRFILVPVYLLLVLISAMSYADNAPLNAPAIALPPAEVIMKACADMGVEAVDMAYVKSKLPHLLSKNGKAFVIDARPARNYDAGHIPTAYNMYDAKFNLIYPEFEKLNLPKDTEIFLGVGRPCPMSLNDAKKLKEKGFTNLKAFVKGPVYVETMPLEVTLKGAKGYMSNGYLLDFSSDAALAKFNADAVAKDKAIVIVGGIAPAYAIAQKIYDMGYKMVFVYDGKASDIQ